MQDKIVCIHCESPNERKNEFCDVCGAKLHDAKTHVDTELTTQQTLQEQKYTQQPKKHWRTILGILGIFFGVSTIILSLLAALTWGRPWVPFIGRVIESCPLIIWTPFLYLGIALIGLIFSAKTSRQNKALRVSGLVISIVNLLFQIGWCIISFMVWHASSQAC